MKDSTLLIGGAVVLGAFLLLRPQQAQAMTEYIPVGGGAGATILPFPIGGGDSSQPPIINIPTVPSSGLQIADVLVILELNRLNRGFEPPTSEMPDNAAAYIDDQGNLIVTPGASIPLVDLINTPEGSNQPVDDSKAGTDPVSQLLDRLGLGEPRDGSGLSNPFANIAAQFAQARSRADDPAEFDAVDPLIHPRAISECIDAGPRS